MRTTIDLPEEIYRAMKFRAAAEGITLKEYVRSAVEQKLLFDEESPLPRCSDQRVELPIIKSNNPGRLQRIIKLSEVLFR
jgi:plasmid stability protein